MVFTYNRYQPSGRDFGSIRHLNGRIRTLRENFNITAVPSSFRVWKEKHRPERFHEQHEQVQVTEGDWTGGPLGVNDSCAEEEMITRFRRDESRPQMVKARVGACPASLRRYGRENRPDWHTGFMIPIFKKGRGRNCSNYRGQLSRAESAMADEKR